MPFPNGIQASRDGKALFVNAYIAGEVRKIGFPGGELLGKASVKGPDNSQWDAEGRLLVASHTAGIVASGRLLRHWRWEPAGRRSRSLRWTRAA